MCRKTDLLGLPISPTCDWDFSDLSDPGKPLVLALPSGTFHVASGFSGSGFSLRPGMIPRPSSCCAFGDGNPIDIDKAIKILGLDAQPTNVEPDRVPDPILSDKFAEAVAYTLRLHRGHARKGTAVPYASHLLAVASLVLEHGGSEVQAIAALLHDAIEDCAGSDPAPLKREIREQFGGEVLRIVEGCSDSERSVGKLPWRIRKDAYLAGICKKNSDTLLVSLADKVHNARCIAADQDAIGDAVWQRFSAPKPEIIWYYESLLTAFCASLFSAPGLLSEFRIAVARMRGGSGGAARR